MFRRCTMFSLLKEVRAALQPQMPDVAGSLLRRQLVGSRRASESHPGEIRLNLRKVKFLFQRPTHLGGNVLLNVK